MTTAKKTKFVDLRSPQREAPQRSEDARSKSESKKVGGTKKGDFVEFKFTGIANGQIFDSNIEEDLKTIDSKAAPQKTIICIGEGMVPTGLDKDLEYKVTVPFKEGFGERRRELVRIIPLKSFTEQKVNPQPGMVFTLDNQLVKILVVSGARVTVDFNNPLSGKDLTYKYKITRILSDSREDEKEKVETLLQFYLRFKPEFEITQDKLILQGPKEFEVFVNAFKEKFKETIGKDLSFQEVKPKEKPTPQTP
jgi:FKBP-type peptidyl-prolyl cis-trans isomerase 2